MTDEQTAQCVASALLGEDTNKDDGDWGAFYFNEARLRNGHFLPLMFYTNKTDWDRWPRMPHCLTVGVTEDGKVRAIYD